MNKKSLSILSRAFFNISSSGFAGRTCSKGSPQEVIDKGKSRVDSPQHWGSYKRAYSSTFPGTTLCEVDACPETVPWKWYAELLGREISGKSLGKRFNYVPCFLLSKTRSWQPLSCSNTTQV